MRRRWILPVVAIAMASLTTLAVINYLRSLQREAAVVAPAKTEAVVFAKASIAERKTVTADALELRELPAAAIHPQAARRIEDVVNRVAVAPIFADEQVLLNKLAPAGVNVGLAYVLPKNKRAMTIAVNEVVGVAGFVFPGDRVDVVGTVNEGDLKFTKIILQDIEVVAIAQKVEQKPGEEPRVSTSATLALSPEQVETLAQIDNSGKVRLALRPYGVTEQVRTSGKTIESALGRVVKPAPGPAPQAAVARTAPRPRLAFGTTALRRSSGPSAPTTTAPAQAAAPKVPAPTIFNVEVWRATTKSVVSFTEARL
ncbi:MAG: Flp pilus assembly protein CpaB [Armatimonadota bacterium]|nr:Flp pilus assembly protein CpaB [Armatimonadota bacterium]MDR7463309.1 Flp pilus assembly protein CpaB [Armatimonadota bacterium]MDR7468957.1 Flp pilus assembly protein CpaB [Armatimonadota bacterium]MDR7474002.1 Flp pilus assembly protein CpaB [Armatimonadota bacterium]MDR7537997.1 Flp pilus assembly protein CpaB [Armatimonadota bacterium]